MDSRVSVYFSSVCLISERQQVRTSSSACVCKDKYLCEKSNPPIFGEFNCREAPARSQNAKNNNTAKNLLMMCVRLIPAPAEVAAQASSGLHISFHLCSCRPFRRQQRISHPHHQERSRCGTRTNETWLVDILCLPLTYLQPVGKTGRLLDRSESITGHQQANLRAP